MSNLLNSLASRVRRTPGGAPQPVVPVRASEPMPVLQEGHLTSILDAMDRTPEARRVGSGVGQWGHYTHVSSLIGACARMHALATLDDRSIMESVTGGHRVMWSIGRYVEQHIRGQYLKATNRRMAFGRWKCVCSESEHVGHHPAMVCDRCQQPLNQYNEYTLFDHENWIKGNPDLLMAFPGNWIVPVEIKSMNAKDFEKLEQPKGDHVFQLGHYHRMLQLERFRVHSHGVVIYCTKEFKFGSPYKEYHVKMDVPAVQAPIEQSVVMARQIRQTREDGTLPPRTMCQSPTETRAKNCPFLVSCWNRD